MRDLKSEREARDRITMGIMGVVRDITKSINGEVKKLAKQQIKKDTCKTKK